MFIKTDVLILRINLDKLECNVIAQFRRCTDSSA